MHRMLAVSAIALVLTACASSSSRPVRSQFEDIPVPSGLTLDQDKSTIIESPTVKAARLVYRGRVEVTSLATAMRATLESSGWRTLSSTTSSDKGTTQVYDKGGDSLQVQIYEGTWYTYVELAGTRLLPSGAPASWAPVKAEAPMSGPAQAQLGQPPVVQPQGMQPQVVQPLAPVPATPGR
jgi:hypothetical protein